MFWLFFGLVDATALLAGISILLLHKNKILLEENEDLKLQIEEQDLQLDLLEKRLTEYSFISENKKTDIDEILEEIEGDIEI